jgi:hypothetical protein
MLYLTEISLRLEDVVNATMRLDPLVAPDIGYCVKTWMADKSGIAVRPWRATTLRDGVRIVGWRSSEPSFRSDNKPYLGVREVRLEAGEEMLLSMRFIPLRRNPRRERDAAEGREDPASVYKAWLMERLVDILPIASTNSIAIEGFDKQKVLRKVLKSRSYTIVTQQVIPVVESIVGITVKDPSEVENWLLRGVGPQKAFGFGAMLPVC